jgi:capsid protein
MLKSAYKAVGKWLGYDKPKAESLSAWQKRYTDLRASYDAARDSTEFQNYWANADAFDADSAHSKEVRHKLIQRSRYEITSNGYSDGIAQTYSTDLVGNGPSLRMQTASMGFNRLVENEWYFWCKAVKFRRKLWCMAHAKHVDGEAFATLRRNPKLRHAIKLDLMLHEADQVQTPYIPYGTPGYIDGIKFDEFGNPEYYDILREHPGATNRLMLDPTPERVEADKVLHWFKQRRPGQHRGVPECASTLNTGAAARRWREATLAAAETAADFTIFLRTQFQPDAEEMQYATDFSQQEITKRMMTALPVGYDPFQMKAEQPTAQYEMFADALVNEQGRPKSMPLNKIKCNSASYNYASGRLDHQTYYGQLDSEREDCNDEVLNPLFDVWFDMAVLRFGWLGGNPDSISQYARAHIWDWPAHAVADIQTEAAANKTKLGTGELTLSQLYAKQGRDFDDDVETMAKDYGVTTDEMRQILRTAIFNSQGQQASMQQADTQAEVAKQQPTDTKPKDGDGIAAILNGKRMNGVANGKH